MPPSPDALVTRVLDEIWNAGDLDLADELFGANYINHGGLIPDLLRGPEVVKFSVALYRTAFPDLHVSIDHLGPSLEGVTVGWTARDTAEGRASQSHPAATLSGTTRVAIADGQVVESWTAWNWSTVLRDPSIFRPARD